MTARTALGIRNKIPLRSPGKFKYELLILDIGKSFVYYTTAEIYCNIKDVEIDKEEEEAICVAVEIS